MKINFAGAYKEVSRLIASPTDGPRPITDTDQFQNTLAALLPKNKQPIEIPKEIVLDDWQDPEPGEMPDNAHASLRMDSPKFMEPELTPQLTPFVPPEPPKIDQNSVKTPTVLDVRRVSVPAIDSMAGFSGQVREMLNAAGPKHGIDPTLAMAVIKVESNFNPRAVSSDGHASKGLFQLLDSTGKDLLVRTESDKKYEPFNPELNVDLGVSYLRYLHDIFSSPTNLPNDSKTRAAANSTSLEKLAVAAFNAGEGRVASAQERAEAAGKDPTVYEHVETYLPKSTQEYVARVMDAKMLY